MSRKVCRSAPGFGTCCQALQAGKAEVPIQVVGANGVARCGICHIIQRTKNRGPGFHFRFLNGSYCGLVSGCPAFTTAGAPATAGVGAIQLPPAPAGTFYQGLPATVSQFLPVR